MLFGISSHFQSSTELMKISAQSGSKASRSFARFPHGFSLIEVTIALGVFAFAMIPIIGLVSSGMKSLRGSMDEGVRGEIVRKVVAEAGRVPYTNLSSFNGTNFYFDDEGVQQASSNAQTIFVASNSVAPPPSLITTNTDIAQLLKVTVRHFADTNNKTVYSQLILNTPQ
jgi:uncharacterized protein (TIGR02598 family)